MSKPRDQIQDFEKAAHHSGYAQAMAEYYPVPDQPVPDQPEHATIAQLTEIATRLRADSEQAWLDDDSELAQAARWAACYVETAIKRLRAQNY